MFLKPSEIRYSQDSINNVFDKRCDHKYKLIGETLDELCQGRCSISDIPTITVVQHDGMWVTADNRRFWVFRQLERLGKCERIYVQQGYYIPHGKRTSENEGVSVIVRGSPGGYWHLQPSMSKPLARENYTDATNNLPYAETNFMKKVAFTTKRKSLVDNKQFDRATYNDDFEKYSSNQFDRASNLNHDVYESNERVTNRGLNDYITALGDTPSRGIVNISQPQALAGCNSSSDSDTESNYKDQTPLISDRGYEGDSAEYVPEQRVYRHKTYDTSYDRDRQNRADSSTTSDVGCCIII